MVAQVGRGTVTGSDRAKATLVLQGCSDPDALAGRIGTGLSRDFSNGEELASDLVCLRRLATGGAQRSRPRSPSPQHRPDDFTNTFT